MNTETIQKTLNGLLTIQNDGPNRNTVGICDNLYKLIPDHYSYDLMGILFKTWEHYSGEEVFPVPGTNGKTPDDAYLCTEGNIWNRSTKYGQLRWLLLDHCITQLQIQLSKT